RECERSYPFKYLSIVRRSTFKSRANWLLLIFILELSISKFNFGKSSSPLISISVLISICICIIFTPKILCITNHLLYILIQSFMYIVRVSFIQAQSIKDISKDCRVSSHTVQREINKASQSFKPARKQLPKHLSFDEFKYAKGNMAFEYINVETGDILDILEQRTKRMITEHFISNYSLKERKKVEYVTIDMNAVYVSVIKEMFPKVNIIIDQFHLVQLINRSMNKIRVHVINTLKTSNNEDMKKYRRLKRYWKLILKSESNLS